MAAMEKITYTPLISHLKEELDFYNHLHKDYEIKYGQLDGAIFTIWMLSVVEPIIKEVTSSAIDKLPSVSKALFSELLRILGNKSGVIHEKDYKDAWSLLKKNPVIVRTHPKRFIQAIDTAIESLREYKPDKVLDWIQLMNGTIVYCQTIEEVLALGRIWAWSCGMAHLRNRAYQEFTLLSPELKKIIKDNSSTNIASSLKHPWMTGSQFRFMGIAGGFIGYGGSFTTPPIIAEVGDQLLATDQRNTFAFFADRMGMVLIPDIPVTPASIAEHASFNEFTSLKTRKEGKFLPFDDVSSCIRKNSTLVFTRKSSHYLYVYGWPAGVV